MMFYLFFPLSLLSLLHLILEVLTATMTTKALGPLLVLAVETFSIPRRLEVRDRGWLGCFSLLVTIFGQTYID